MEAFLATYGLTNVDLINIAAIVIFAFIVLGVLRAALRLTKTIMRMGCATIFLGVGVYFLWLFLNP